MGSDSVSSLFVFLSLALAGATALGLVVFAFRFRSETRAVRDQMESALELQSGLASQAVAAAEKAEPAKLRALLEEFEAAVTQRIQRTERAFAELGDEVTEALDRAQRLDRSASAKRSRARVLEREAEEKREQAESAPAPDAQWWLNPNLSHEEKIALARHDLLKRGINV